MTQRAPRWTVDPRDPGAPPREVWDALSPAERRALVDALPKRGRLESQVLGLWLALEPAEPPSTLPRLRFYAGTAVVPEPEELAERLEATVTELVHQRAEAEAARSDAEAARSDAERRLADALAEIERLKRGR